MFWSNLAVYGPLGVFIISFVSNAIPYATIPYLIVIAQLASSIPSPPYIAVISILGGIGATGGKLVIYMLGSAVGRVLSEEARENMLLFTRIAEKSMFLAILLFAALPLPDDVLYIPLGVAGYDIIKYFFAILIGKIIITFTAACFGGALGILVQTRGLTWWVSLVVSLIATVVLTYVIYIIDWSKVVMDVDETGWLRFLVKALRKPSAYVRKASRKG